MRSKSMYRFVPFIFIVLLFVGCWGAIQLSRKRAEERARSANPLNDVSSLRGKPILILSTDLDQNFPLSLHGSVLCEKLGKECKIFQYPAIGMGYAFMFDKSRVMRFMEATIPAGTTVILLHGVNAPASSWDRPFRDSMPADRYRFDLANALRKKYPCETVELGAQSWGNDASVRTLDRRVGSRTSVVLLGETMGALTMLRWAEKNPQRVAALIGILPACDLKDISEGVYGKEVRKAYGSW